MGIVYVIYALLLAVFLVMSALIFRHTMKYGYLSPKFKTIVTIFGLLALGIIIFSLYLVISLSRASDKPRSPFSTPSTNTVSPGKINF